MADMKTEWAYPLIETTLDKRLSRPGVQKGLAAELTGVDGSDEGGLRPFPGFKRVFTFSDLPGVANHSAASEVVDFHPIDFRIGAEHYGYGFVYRAKRPATPTVSDVFLDYWNSGTQSWTRVVKLMDAVDTAAQFDCEVAGRFVYCFATGRSPSLFYVDATNEKVYYPEADSYIDSANATTNYGGQQNLRIAGTSPSTYNNKSLFRFNTTAESNQTVEEATLEFTVTENFNTAASTSLDILLVNDPSDTNTYWVENEVTWDIRATAVNWQTAGGTTAGSPTAAKTLPAAYKGRVVTDVKTLVQACLTTAGRPQDFGFKTDFLVRGISGGNIVHVASKEQANTSIRPKLMVKYSSTYFFTNVVVGSTVSGDLPGPGLQPLLKSPESSVPIGDFISLDDNRPGAAQIVMRESEPYASTDIFPNSVTGLCSTDTLPTPPTPGSTSPPSPISPLGTACDAAQTEVNVGLRTVLINPSYKQTNVSVTPELDWSTFHTAGMALPTDLVWDVYFGKQGAGDINDDDELRVATALTVTKYEPSALFASGKLEYNTKYYWRIRGRRSTSCEYKFTSSTSWFVTEDLFRARKLEPGDYAFGYMLVDSRTGRKSAFSEVAQARAEDFRVSTNNTNVQREQYVGIEIVYDSGKYDLMYVYRSVKIQDAGGTMVAGIPFLDAIIYLEDYHTCKNGTGRTFDPAVTDNRHAMYFYELEDKQLVYQTPYIDRSIFDQKMPFGGAALFYDGTMIVSKIDAQPDSSEETVRVEDINKGLGEMRWSSLQEFSPELFPPFNRYNPTLPSSEVITFSKVGANALGISKDRVYHIRKSGGFIRIQEMHEGYGVVNHKAVDAVGSVAYYASPHGLKAVDAQAQLDELRILNQVFVKEWVSDMNDIQLGYDPTMNTMFLLNPNKEEAYCLWFSTAKTTKLEDLVFDHVAQGAWPSNFTSSEYANPLQRRAMFLMNPPAGAVGWSGPRVYVVDYARSKSIVGGTASWNGNRRITTLDFDGDSRVIATGAISTGTFAISPTGLTPTITSANAWTGCYLYCVHSATHPQHVGKKTRIVSNTSVGVTVDTVPTWTADIHSGMVFGVSPVYFEWVGHNLGLNNEVNQVFSLADFFRIKMAHTVGCAFTDVAGPPVTDTLTANNPMNRFMGVLYSGTDEDPVAKAQTKETDGSLYGSIEDGEGLVYAAFGTDSSDGRYGAKGNSLSPGVRIFCPDLDYRLLACSVRGNILTMERSATTRGS
jgi:hypothetical protein